MRAQIGAAITSLFADILRLGDADRRRLVICGIGAGFAAVFGTPVSGAFFGIEVLYLGRIEYPVLFPCLVAGIVAHLVCGVGAPIPGPVGFPIFEQRTSGHGMVRGSRFSSASPLAWMALLLIETMRRTGDHLLRRFAHRPFAVAVAGGGIFLVAFYTVFGNTYAGLGIDTIEAALWWHGEADGDAGVPAARSSPPP